MITREDTGSVEVFEIASLERAHPVSRAHSFRRLPMGRDLAFTTYIRASLEEGSPVDGPVLDELWKQLRGVLVRELRARGLWSLSPRLLGIHGCESWLANDEEALGELASDCFLVAILHRLPTFEVHLQVKANVEGLVFRAIRNFLYDLQKRHDPLGFQVFTFLRRAMRKAVEDGYLRLLGGDPGIRNDTILGFVNADESTRFEPEVLERTTNGTVEAVLGSWVRQTAPGFALGVLQSGEKGQQRLARQLIDRLPELEKSFNANLYSEKIQGFHFKILVDLWKSESRGNWLSLLTQQIGIPDDEPGGRNWRIPMTVAEETPGFEARQAYLAMRRCVEEGIDQVEGSSKTRDRLHCLWSTLEGLAADDAPVETRKSTSDRGLERLLGIPRRNLSKLRQLLQRLVIQCGGNRP